MKGPNNWGPFYRGAKWLRAFLQRGQKTEGPFYWGAFLQYDRQFASGYLVINRYILTCSTSDKRLLLTSSPQYLKTLNFQIQHSSLMVPRISKNYQNIPNNGFGLDSHKAKDFPSEDFYSKVLTQNHLDNIFLWSVFPEKNNKLIELWMNHGFLIRNELM